MSEDLLKVMKSVLAESTGYDEDDEDFDEDFECFMELLKDAKA